MGQLFDHWTSILPLFSRTMGLLLLAPLFSSRGVPAVARVILGALVTVVALPVEGSESYPLPSGGLAIVFVLFGEFLIGAIIALILRIVFVIFQLAGQMFTLQMGFGSSQVFDPLAQIEIPLVGQYLNLIALYLFLVVQGPLRILFSGVYHSFRVLKATDLLVWPSEVSSLLIHLGSGLFLQALLIGIPIMGVLFLISITIGLLTKAAPQMNLLMIGFPIQIFSGFLIFLATSPFIIGRFTRIIDWGFQNIVLFLKHSQGVGP